MEREESSKESVEKKDQCGFTWEHGGLHHDCGLQSKHEGPHKCCKPFCLQEHVNGVSASDKVSLNYLYGELAASIQANDFARRDKLFAQICDIVNKH